MSRLVLSTNDIIEALEDADIEDSVQGVDVYIDPPCEGTLSDGDSGDEDCQDINRLNRHQLLAPAEMVLLRRNDDDDDTVAEVVGVTPTSHAAATGSATPETNSRRLRRPRPVEEQNEQSIRSSNEEPESTEKSRSTRSTRDGGRSRQQNIRPRKWVKQDLRTQQTEWSPPPPRVVLTLTKHSEPIDFFELFFTEDVITYIVRHTVMYAVEKHNYNFCLSGDEIYCFIGVLILSGYAPLPRRRMYWEVNEDTHNVLVAKSMRRNRFEEIFRFLHVCDNNNLQPGDKMAKIRPLFNIMNEKFLMYAPIEKNFSVEKSMIPYYIRRSIARSLLHKYGNPNGQPGPQAPPSTVKTNISVSVRKYAAQHIILTGQIRRRCVLCKNKTVKICRKCNVNLHDKCFEAYHA